MLCPGRHPLVHFTAPNSTHTCDVCNRRQAVHAHLRSCRRCDFDMCGHCETSILADSAVVKADDLPRKVGARVRRGPDWKWGDQDGGQGNLGTLTGESAGTCGCVWVRWDNGTANNYHADHTFDLEYADSLEDAPDAQMRRAAQAVDGESTRTMTTAAAAAAAAAASEDSDSTEDSM
mmetsp:Transcript_56342/g.182516  ORF Transcript_56342/g.182516 Transcript_56342/m.182516 type:complete len:177 (-) Transcript_56342:172-702(-)|eukprot:CAMPEP_0204207010 /NCGR_PEP_ID=MMETSP0361-20130328/71466_1 /ASSEMBLY_ACC=CAM_ASM_000343 /TAXON_ID=268821 /ORGANISM="Scrippsiella Hangoei, Strain SHTV-5" /LENGTH=176 /DNA_ID=CAMNT_0051170533 /DNA_START=104 /DNA_END=634 /DNA_ORIENTATION=-